MAYQDPRATQGDTHSHPDGFGPSNSSASSHPGASNEHHPSWSAPISAPFAGHYDNFTPSSAGPGRTFDHHGPPSYASTMYQQQPQWMGVDYRCSQRPDHAAAHMRGQPRPPYMYPQSSVSYDGPHGQHTHSHSYVPHETYDQHHFTSPTAFDTHHHDRAVSHYYPYMMPHSPTYPGYPGSYDVAPQYQRPHYQHNASHSYSRSYSQSPHSSAPMATKTMSGAQKPSPQETPSYPRGPPRKPKQSGHALWVGNLPPGTNIMDLKDYFSRGATKTIESLFLISKSNCAFVNYHTVESCQAAMARFHDSRFHGTRLVCRLRHGQTPAMQTVETSGVVGGGPKTDGFMPDIEPESLSPETEKLADDMAKVDISETDKPEEGIQEVTVTKESRGPSELRVQEKYFIVKSLTLQDLEASVRDGIWATQSHNEAALNKAFSSAQSVYLIFSANKSGEYYGYAKMRSAINPSTVTANPRAETTAPTASDGPIATPTPATEHAPKGRIIDDSARGTIFWEADSSDSENDSSEPNASNENQDGNKCKADANKQDWGRPFEIEWMNTSRLPFYKTRGLRNAWNSNREVKIARDGTELESSVGRRLLDLFHQGPPPNAGSVTGVAIQSSKGPVVAYGSKTAGPQPPVAG